MNGPILTKEESERYGRHLVIPGFGKAGQEKLKAASVLVVGAGGLGAPLLQYLAASGVGTLGIVDHDVVEESNLQRQVLFTRQDLGQPKARVAAKRLEALNPFIRIVCHETRLSSSNAIGIIQQYDVVADGTDNFPTRYLVNDACVLCNKPNVFASVFRFDGQVSVFNYTDESGTKGPNYRDVFPEPPPPNAVMSCEEGGVLGVVPGILGSIQANEVIKVVTGLGKPLSGKLLMMDLMNLDVRVIRIRRDNNVPAIKELIDYDLFCGLRKTANPVKEISARQLELLIDSGEQFQLVDVREQHEYEAGNINGELIPLSQVELMVSHFAKDKKVIVHCRTGKRSAQAISILESKHGFDNLYNLKEGLLGVVKLRQKGS